MALLTPRKVKHRKHFKARTKGVSQKGNTIAFGSFALKGIGERWITARQIEAARRAIMRYLKKGGKLWIRIFPDRAVTKKGGEVGMGGGKGKVDHYIFPIKIGRIIFELAGVTEEVARDAFSKASDKLPIKTKFIKKD